MVMSIFGEFFKNSVLGTVNMLHKNHGEENEETWEEKQQK